MKRRSILITSASLLMTAPAAMGKSPAPREADMAEDINKAGRQRMLSQRISKAWLAQAMGIQANSAKDIQDKSIALFESQLTELQAHASKPEIADTYSKLRQAFGEFRQAIMSASPNIQGTAQILALDAKVLTLAHQGTVQLEASWGKPSGQLVNLAGRQRMLSQRMAKLYLAAAAGQSSAAAQAELDKVKAEFVQALQTLHKAPESNSRIKDELQLADMQWIFFEKALQTLHPGHVVPRMASDVFVTSENLLAVMDKVTGLYATLKT